jgi:hypothetical protein
MPLIARENDNIDVDATIIGEGLCIDPLLVQARIRDGKIATLCEHGVDKDTGRDRLTFFFESRRFRLIVDQRGKVIQRSTVDFGSLQLPTSMHRPGT